MGRAPDVIIIARHGARLDAADKTWHLTSPTPYDPPLTYGGWTQSRALGTRIASLLHAHQETHHSNEDLTSRHTNDADGYHADGRNSRASSSGASTAGRGKKRKQKIVIHSSPFLRCVQTSIAISAGVAQYRPPHERAKRDPSMSPRHRSRSPGVRVLEGHRNGTLSPISEPDEYISKSALKATLGPEAPPKATIRLDAFLGEWLSPDYFDLITPPPNSTMMIAGAKADLLRRGEYIEVPQTQDHKALIGHFPGGWAKPNPTPGDSMTSVYSGLGTLSQALPLRDRASSIGSVGSNSGRSPHKGASSISAGLKNDHGAYVAPTPGYAISPSDPIPRGYVAHARDACVDVDYQWDSMREPQKWGDGGEYGEEWSSMHKRFRKGLHDMIAWYKDNGYSGTPFSGHAKVFDDSSEDDEDADTEIVLILVTHGAGCNALIGGLTNQPVLLDVGMASLTMAVHKDTPAANENMPPRSDSPTQQRASLAETNLSDPYEMRLVASIEHLRPGYDPHRVSHMPSPKLVTGVSENRRRLGSHASAGSPIDAPFNIGEPAAVRGVNSALGSMRRSSLSNPATTSRVYSPSNTSRVTSSQPGLPGLWTKTLSPVDTNKEETVSSPSGDFLLNFGDSAASSSSTASKMASKPLKPTVTTWSSSENSKGPSASDASSTSISMPPPSSTTTPSSSSTIPSATSPTQTPITRAAKQFGLWGSQLNSGALNERERGAKRRWTINEREWT